MKLHGMLVRGQQLHTYVSLLESKWIKMEDACQGDTSVHERVGKMSLVLFSITQEKCSHFSSYVSRLGWGGSR